MRLSYDPKTDSLYIHLIEKPSVDRDERGGSARLNTSLG